MAGEMHPSGMVAGYSAPGGLRLHAAGFQKLRPLLQCMAQARGVRLGSFADFSLGFVPTVEADNEPARLAHRRGSCQSAAPARDLFGEKPNRFSTGGTTHQD